MSFPANKPRPCGVARHYKPVVSDPTLGARTVLLRSFLVKGDFIELIAAEDQRTGDDAYIQAIRDEINQKGPFHGAYASKLGLLQIASRRLSPEPNEVMRRHTGPKKNKWGTTEHDEFGQEIYFPRQFIVRLVPEQEREKGPEERMQYRKKALSTVAKIMHEHDSEKRKSLSPANSPSKAPLRRKFSPTVYIVPKEDWDRTPEPLRPLDWYITDQMVAGAIQSLYVEKEIGAWRMFAENVLDADCFFSPPYSYVAKTFGFRNPGESSVREPVPPNGIGEEEAAATLPQGYDDDDVLPLEN